MFFLKKLINIHDNELKKINYVVNHIISYHSYIKKLTNNELKNQTIKLKNKLKKGYTLNDILPEAFATVKEVIFRLLGINLYNVQLLGGIVLHQGRIAEMKTGEGKTLVATLPAYLNALQNNNVHIITVNDYLAKRDSEWMKPIYNFLNLNVGVILSNMDFKQKKIAYLNNIIYGTNNEFAFDYLKDNMVITEEKIVQKERNYAIIDEVDSILIDEARTPLIISGDNNNNNNIYTFANIFSKKLKGIKIKEFSNHENYNDLLYHFIIDEKNKNISLTNFGLDFIEKQINIKKYNDNNLYTIHTIIQSLKAIFLMKNDVDYIIKDNKIIIVDEFTGRLMPDKRYSNGLHQAIEAKENLKIQNENKTLASITFQNYFKTYKKISGMTGTAITEEKEFQQIYNLDVIKIPTNKQIIRNDMPDIIYKTKKAKLKAIIKKIIQCNKIGQPVLVGTISIEKSEEISSELKKHNVNHLILNAKSHYDEANIISQAGKLYSVTIATNMAGRGTDIILGGNFNNYYENKNSNSNIEKVKNVGGLMIIGTEKHESRRIDNQLRGRAGRQGDPGCSIFYTSLEDNLLRLFGSEKVIKIMNKLGINENIPLQGKFLSDNIEKAQMKIENQNFNIRKNLLQYDTIINLQRHLIYKQRNKILNEKFDLLITTKTILRNVINVYLNKKTKNKKISKKYYKTLIFEFLQDFNFKSNDINKDYKYIQNRIELEKFLFNYLLEIIKNKIINQNQNLKIKLLEIIDKHWINYININQELRLGIGLRGYSYYDPILEYKKESLKLYDKIIDNIKHDFIRNIIN